MTGTAVVYFSRAGENYFNGSIRRISVGNTQIAAETVRGLTGADLFPLEPVGAYPDDYKECIDRAKAELEDRARPALRAVPAVAAYRTVILAFPNWWGTAPMAVRTFLDAQPLAGKQVLLLCTNEGSGMGSSEKDLRQACPDAVFGPSLALRGGAVKEAKGEITGWLKEAGLL